MKTPKIIVVSKIGRSPDIFNDKNDSGRYMAMGDWEVLALLKVLSDLNINDKIIYVGRCYKWDVFQVDKHFKNNNVSYIRYSHVDKYTQRYSLVLNPALEHIDEFHYILGPAVTGTNNALDVASLKQNNQFIMKKTIEIAKNYTGPIYALMNCHKNALHFPYMTDNKYSIDSLCHISSPRYQFCQIIKPFSINILKLVSVNDPLTKELEELKYIPMRLETLYLYDKIKVTINYDEWKLRSSTLALSMNQVSADNQLTRTRFEQFKSKIVSDFTSAEVKILGKWSAPEMINNYLDYFLDKNTNGFSNNYEEKMREFKYSIILINNNVAIRKHAKNVKNNWTTLKIIESFLLGNLTFFEIDDISSPYYDYFDKEFLFATGKELKEKIIKCETDEVYVQKLISIQNNMLKSSYFDGTYFENFINNIRKYREAKVPLFMPKNDKKYQSVDDVKNKNVRFQELNIWPDNITCKKTLEFIKNKAKNKVKNEKTTFDLF